MAKICDIVKLGVVKETKHAKPKIQLKLFTSPDQFYDYFSSKQYSLEKAFNLLEKTADKTCALYVMLQFIFNDNLLKTLRLSFQNTDNIEKTISNLKERAVRTAKRLGLNASESIRKGKLNKSGELIVNISFEDFKIELEQLKNTCRKNKKSKKKSNIFEYCLELPDFHIENELKCLEQIHSPNQFYDLFVRQHYSKEKAFRLLALSKDYICALYTYIHLIFDLELCKKLNVVIADVDKEKKEISKAKKYAFGIAVKENVCSAVKYDLFSQGKMWSLNRQTLLSLEYDEFINYVRRNKCYRTTTFPKEKNDKKSKKQEELFNRISLECEAEEMYIEQIDKSIVRKKRQAINGYRK